MLAFTQSVKLQPPKPHLHSLRTKRISSRIGKRARQDNSHITFFTILHWRQTQLYSTKKVHPLHAMVQSLVIGRVCSHHLHHPGQQQYPAAMEIKGILVSSSLFYHCFRYYLHANCETQLPDRIWSHNLQPLQANSNVQHGCICKVCWCSAV